jgi:hypothetical protein
MAEEWNGKKCSVCEKVYSIFQSGWTYFSFDGTMTCSDDCKIIHRKKK